MYEGDMQYEPESNRAHLQPAYKALQENASIVCQLIAQMPPQLMDSRWRGTTLLSKALLQGNLSAVECLLQRGADPSTCSQVFDPDEQVLRLEPPLITAARIGFVEGVEALVSAKAHLDQVDNTTGKSALHWACIHPTSREAAIYLAQTGADPNSADHYLETPMAKVIRNRDVGLAKVLLDSGYLLDEPVNYHKDSALVYALSTGAVLIAKCLLCAGADPSAADHHGRDALALAMQCPELLPSEVSDLCQMLMAAGAEPKQCHLVVAAERQLVGAAQVMCARMRSPSSLMDCCRLHVRKALLDQQLEPRSLLPALETLPLPPMMLKFLALITL